uniref:Retrotransposon gag domain-containing protein n=1 Tax=Myripristis murdjan TaxID=586833 RepID=A0A667ZPK5_9TELE
MLRPNDPQCKLNTSDHSYATKLKSASPMRLEDNFTETQANPPKQSYGSKELSKVLSTLVHGLLAQVKLSKSEVAELKQESHLNAQLEDSKLIQEGKNKQILELQEENIKLQKDLRDLQSTMGQQKPEAHGKDTARLEELLFKAEEELRDSRCRIKALEGHLDDTKRQTRDLEQSDQKEIETMKQELQHSYSVRQERSLPPTSSPSVAPRLVRQPSAALKDLDRVARNINTFTPSPSGGHDVHAYLQDVEYHAGQLPQATDEDRLHLIRITSSLEVRSFLDRQTTSVKTDYTQLKQALIREFADPESEQGLTTALDIKQGRQETPQAYYQRLQRAYFGSRNELDMEEDANFKTLFLRNLHPTVSHFLGVMACPRTMTSLQLRDLARKAFNKQRQRAALKKLSKTATVLSLDGDAPQRLPAAHPNEDSQFMPWSKSRNDQRKEPFNTDRLNGRPRKERTWRPSRGDKPARLSPPSSPRSSRSSRQLTYRRESRSGSPQLRLTSEDLSRIVKEVTEHLRPDV